MQFGNRNLNRNRQPEQFSALRVYAFAHCVANYAQRTSERERERSRESLTHCRLRLGTVGFVYVLLGFWVKVDAVSTASVVHCF